MSINLCISVLVVLHKGKVDRYICRSPRGINLVSIPAKVYGRITKNDTK